MKKMIAALIAVMIMLASCAASFAEVGEEIVEMDHGTAMVWLDDDLYTFILDDVYEEDGVIYAFFNDNYSGYELSMALSTDLGVDYYEAAEIPVDRYALIVYEPDGTYHYATCASYAVNDGCGCDLCMTVFDENGWYQGIVIGNTVCDNSYESFELVSAFDFVLETASFIGTNAGGSCSVCSGTGSCIYCNYGECIYCKLDTRYCFCSNGRCTICDGAGFTSYYDYYNHRYEYDDCSHCGGSGRHAYCGGAGVLPCVICNGTEMCSHCYGTCICDHCNGSGMN